jgi:mannose-6-phosphate isomerase
VKLRTHYVEKPWGRTELPTIFGGTDGRRIGEVWFEGPEGSGLPLLAKYIFTSERLSIQVHPDDREAHARGLPQGKNECWYILGAEPGATLGLGLKRALEPDALREAALGGSIEDLIDWRPVKPGDFFFVPAGTIHAIGGGISLLEFQQNVDVTYRLYDYGRPRELHVEDAVAVAKTSPFEGNAPSGAVLLDGPHFTLIRARSSVDADPLSERQRWVMPLEGAASSGDERAAPGECLLIEGGAPLQLSAGGLVLVGAAGAL